MLRSTTGLHPSELKWDTSKLGANASGIDTKYDGCQEVDHNKRCGTSGSHMDAIHESRVGFQTHKRTKTMNSQVAGILAW